MLNFVVYQSRNTRLIHTLNCQRFGILKNQDEKFLAGLVNTKPLGFGVSERVLRQIDKYRHFCIRSITYVLKTVSSQRVSLVADRYEDTTLTGVSVMRNYVKTTAIQNSKTNASFLLARRTPKRPHSNPTRRRLQKRLLELAHILVLPVAEGGVL